MRFISIFTHEPTHRPPTEAEMATMGKLIEDGMKAGWLIATEGVNFGATGVRVHKSAGRITVIDVLRLSASEKKSQRRCTMRRSCAAAVRGADCPRPSGARRAAPRNDEAPGR